MAMRRELDLISSTERPPTSAAGGRVSKPVADDIRSRKKSFPIVWAFEHAPADVSARLRQIYRAPTVTEDDVDEALVLLAEAGAQEAAASEAARWADRALATLDPLDLAPERKRDLEALGNFFVHREA